VVFREVLRQSCGVLNVLFSTLLFGCLGVAMRFVGRFWVVVRVLLM